MTRWFRRLVLVAAVGGAAVLVSAVWQRRVHRDLGPPVWPPVPAGGQPTPPATPRWVEPVAGDCPAGWPVKVNVRSGIYHVPGGRFYDRTRADRCYASAADAEADGYRASKS